jgi:hypothetical protein
VLSEVEDWVDVYPQHFVGFVGGGEVLDTGAIWEGDSVDVFL